MVILKAQGIDTIEEASRYREKVLYMKRSEAQLPEGSWFIQELIDCTVVDADDESKTYGIISNVSETGANDVWHITKDGKEYLVPAIDEVIISVDTDEGSAVLRPMKGIFDDED